VNAELLRGAPGSDDEISRRFFFHPGVDQLLGRRLKGQAAFESRLQAP
jgi:hypothetical protein